MEVFVISSPTPLAYLSAVQDESIKAEQTNRKLSNSLVHIKHTISNPHIAVLPFTQLMGIWDGTY